MQMDNKRYVGHTPAPVSNFSFHWEFAFGPDTLIFSMNMCKAEQIRRDQKTLKETEFVPAAEEMGILLVAAVVSHDNLSI
jgi:hypothetical protein